MTGIIKRKTSGIPVSYMVYYHKGHIKIRAGKKLGVFYPFETDTYMTKNPDEPMQINNTQTDGRTSENGRTRKENCTRNRTAQDIKHSETVSRCRSGSGWQIGCANSMTVLSRWQVCLTGLVDSL